MKKVLLIPVSFLLIFLLQDCATTKTAPAPAVVRVWSKERIITKPFDKIWQSTIELLATYNMPIKNLDKTSGFISTEYKEITGDPSQYMGCNGSSYTFSGKVELTNKGGNMNILVKRISDDSTQVTVNCFYSCTMNRYKYANLLSTNYVLLSSTREDCISNGGLETAILDYLSGAPIN